MIREIEREIQENLDQIEKTQNVKILMAVESGSRGWGFASPDSDYDVRFIYVHHPYEYLRIDPMKDTIEWKLDEVLDINGWDLKKALTAFGKGNPNIMEWAQSPIVYRKSEDWEKIREISFRYFSKKGGICHYCGAANSTFRQFLTGDRISYKKYLYALRPLLCCRWIERYEEPAPMRFAELLSIFSEEKERFPEGLCEEIEELLKRKAITREKNLNPHMPVIRDFIISECERQKLLSEQAPDDHRHDFEELNQLFRFVLKRMQD